MCTPFFKYYSELTLRKLRIERENRLKDVKYAILLEVESTEFIERFLGVVKKESGSRALTIKYKNTYFMVILNLN